jgi:hypothetical protein
MYIGNGLSYRMELILKHFGKLYKEIKPNLVKLKLVIMVIMTLYGFKMP